MVRPKFELIMSLAVAAVSLYMLFFGGYQGTTAGLAFGANGAIAMLSIWASGAALVRTSSNASYNERGENDG